MQGGFVYQQNLRGLREGPDYDDTLPFAATQRQDQAVVRAQDHSEYVGDDEAYEAYRPDEGHASGYYHGEDY